MSGNMELWNSVERTPKEQTKPITGKTYKGTSPKPHYIVQKATETFGPCGIGWGFTISERVEEGAPGDKLHIAHVRVWYIWKGSRGEVEHIGQTMLSGTRKGGFPYTDEDAPKKSVTDGLIKALSMIGFAADIFLGRYDDSKYVSSLDDGERAIEKPTTKDADPFAPDIAGDIVARINKCATSDALKAYRNDADFKRAYSGLDDDDRQRVINALKARAAELGIPVAA